MFKLLYISTLIIMPLAFSDISCSDNHESPVKRIVVELNIGEYQNIQLSNGDIVHLTLLEITEIRDSLRNAVRAANVKISVDGEEIILNSGNYNLPVTVGKVQIDCPVFKNYYNNAPYDVAWELLKDARFRLWPKGSPYIKPGSFVYPIKQAWFAGKSQSGNEPAYVNTAEYPLSNKLYYHAFHDIGGTEGMDEIVSATEGLVISANNEILDGYDSISTHVGWIDIKSPDAVCIIDNRGWLAGYLHLNSIDPAIKPGVKVRMGQKIGNIGMQGSAGGWVHLHFLLCTKDFSSGRWVAEDAYAYLWESYIHQFKPHLMAIARPHQLVWTGQEVILDGRKSISLDGDIISCKWTFTDGTTAEGALQKKNYSKPGEYSEILKVTDSKGNVDYDFSVIQVYDRSLPENPVPSMHAAYYPTINIRSGDPVTFSVRSFNCEAGNEVWNFGDGSTYDMHRSANTNWKAEGTYGKIVHSFPNSGDYIVRVESINKDGIKAIDHLHVVVNK
jgi:murein DD-endopeptidase MepM/ murein hydrolase activator NlpD